MKPEAFEFARVLAPHQWRAIDAKTARRRRSGARPTNYIRVFVVSRSTATVLRDVRGWLPTPYGFKKRLVKIASS